jgi:hypothetical protein
MFDEQILIINFSDNAARNEPGAVNSELILRPKLGDPIETAAVGRVFGDEGVYIGSVSVKMMLPYLGMAADKEGQTKFRSQ